MFNFINLLHHIWYNKNYIRYINRIKIAERTIVHAIFYMPSVIWLIVYTFASKRPFSTILKTSPLRMSTCLFAVKSLLILIHVRLISIFSHISSKLGKLDLSDYSYICFWKIILICDYHIGYIKLLRNVYLFSSQPSLYCIALYVLPSGIQITEFWA